MNCFAVATGNGDQRALIGDDDVGVAQLLTGLEDRRTIVILDLGQGFLGENQAIYSILGTTLLAIFK